MANKKAVVISTLSQNIDNADTLLVGAGIDASAAGALAIGASTATSVVVTPNVGIGGAPTTKLDVTTGQLAIPAGTAAAPGIAIRGDLNNGIFSPGTDQLAVTTAGAQRMVVDASGNVGVGITAPTARLHTVGGLLQTGGSISLTGNAASAITTSAGALTLTSAAGATWSTSAGALTVSGSSQLLLQSASGNAGPVTVSVGSQSTANANGGRLTLSAGDANGTGSGGDVWINQGATSTGVPGTIRLANNVVGQADVKVGSFQTRLGLNMNDLSNTPAASSFSVYANPTDPDGGGVGIFPLGNPTSWNPVPSLGTSIFTGLIAAGYTNPASNKMTGIITADLSNPKSSGTYSSVWLMQALNGSAPVQTMNKASIGHSYVGGAGDGRLEFAVAGAGQDVAAAGAVYRMESDGTFSTPSLALRSTGSPAGGDTYAGQHVFMGDSTTKEVEFGDAIEPRYEAFNYDDFNRPSLTAGDTLYTTGAVGGGSASTSSIATGFMVATLTTGLVAAVNDGVIVYAPVSGLRFNGPVSFKCRVQIPALATVATDFVFRIGVRDITVPSSLETDGIYYEYNRAVGGDFWRCVTCNAGTRVIQTTTQAVTAGSWIALEWVWRPTGTVNFNVNGLPIHTASGASVPTSGSSCNLSMTQYKTTAVATSRSAYVDYWSMAMYPNPLR